MPSRSYVSTTISTRRHDLSMMHIYECFRSGTAAVKGDSASAPSSLSSSLQSTAAAGVSASVVTDVSDTAEGDDSSSTGSESSDDEDELDLAKATRSKHRTGKATQKLPFPQGCTAQLRIEQGGIPGTLLQLLYRSNDHSAHRAADDELHLPRVPELDAKIDSLINVDHVRLPKAGALEIWARNVLGLEAAKGKRTVISR